MAKDPTQPIIEIRDEFGGANRLARKVLTLNLMAKGPVSTPSGRIEPEERTMPYKREGSNEVGSCPLLAVSCRCRPAFLD